MEPTDNESLIALTREQIEQLALVVLEECGAGLDGKQFNDMALLLLENLPGIELMTHKRLSSYVQAMWVVYRTTVTSGRTH